MPATTRASGKNASSGSTGESGRKGCGGKVEGKTNNITQSGSSGGGSGGGGGGEKEDKLNGGKRKRSESESSTSDGVAETMGPSAKISNTSSRSATSGETTGPPNKITKASRSAASGGSFAVLNDSSRGPSIKAGLMKPSTLPASVSAPVTCVDAGSTSLTGRQLVNSISKRIDAEVKLLLDDIVPRTIDELGDLLRSVNFDRVTLAERVKQDESNQNCASNSHVAGCSSMTSVDEIINDPTSRPPRSMNSTKIQPNVAPHADDVSNDENTPFSSVHEMIISQQKIVTRILDDLIERTIKLQTWITSHFPRIIEGQQIGVVTRALAQLAAEEAKNFAQRTQEEMKDYETDWQTCVSAAKDHPHVDDAQLNMVDCSEREFYAMRHTVDEVRSFYVYMQRVISCNREKLEHSDDTSVHNYMFM